MTKKVANRLNAEDVTLEVAPLPVTESETAPIPALEAKVEAPAKEADKDLQAVKVLELKIAELEDKFIKLQTELNTHVNRKKIKKLNKEKFNKQKKVKCKDKKVDTADCKCESKKQEKINKLDNDK